MFRALYLTTDNDQLAVAIKQLETSQLPGEDVVVAVDYSSLNYKDALAITGRGRIIRQFPMVPGIDFSGRVIQSKDNRYQTGDAVILTGWGVGEKHWGGIAEQAAVNGDWLVPLPTGLDSRQAMIIGTAGFTAMLSVMALQDGGITPDSGEILVTGASGGVGSTAITLLHAMGYSVVAVTGRVTKNGDYLRQLGASTIIERDELNQPSKPLETSRFAGAIDSVGSQILAKTLAQMQPGGVVAACGLAAGIDLPTTVMPFILRGVKLIGIDSVYCPREKRLAAWQALTKHLPDNYYQRAGQEIPLDDVPAVATQLIDGEITGRVIIKLQ